MINIAIIGIDGSGKSTLIKNTRDKLIDMHKKVYVKNLKGANYKLINEILGQNTVDDEIRVVINSLDLLKNYYSQDFRENAIVLWDRYVHCIMACNHVKAVEKVKKIISKIPLPDRTYCLDIDPEIAYQRISERNDRKSFETKEYLYICRERYLNLGKEMNIEYLKADIEESTLVDKIIKDIIDLGL